MDAQHSSANGKHNLVQQLRGFCYAALTGSITKAAERISLTQPSVSLQIQALERELGTTLFRRRGTGIRLTSEGKMLLDLALPLIEQVEALPRTFAELRGMPNRGELDIAAAESTLLYLLPQFVKRFSIKYPEIRFRLHNVTGLDGLGMLRADDFDFGIGSMIEMQDDISYRPLFTYGKVLITAREHALASVPKPTLRDISAHGLILPPPHLNTWRLVKMVFAQHGLECRVLFEVGGWEVIKKYVEQNLGVSIVTSICLTGGENLHVAPMGQYFPSRTYGVVMRRNKLLSLQARLFIEMLQTEPSKSAVPPQQTPTMRRAQSASSATKTLIELAQRQCMLRAMSRSA
jgi:DNA-binding transcriptional LysR family regulator